MDACVKETLRTLAPEVLQLIKGLSSQVIVSISAIKLTKQLQIISLDLQMYPEALVAGTLNSLVTGARSSIKSLDETARSTNCLAYKKATNAISEMLLQPLSKVSDKLFEVNRMKWLKIEYTGQIANMDISIDYLQQFNDAIDEVLAE